MQTLKTYALSTVGSVVSATLKRPTYGLTRVRLVDVTDRVTTHYGVLSRSDIAVLDTRLTTYSPSLSLAQSFTVYEQTQAPHEERQLLVPDTRKLDNLYTALQSNLIQKVRFDQYLYLHPSRITQSYSNAKKCLLQLERSPADLPTSSLVPVALPHVATAAIAPAPPPTAVEFAALNAQLARLIKERDTSLIRSVRVSQPIATLSTQCRQCATATLPVQVMYKQQMQGP